jgi:hypothetical protein
MGAAENLTFLKFYQMVGPRSGSNIPLAIEPPNDLYCVPGKPQGGF